MERHPVLLHWLCILIALLSQAGRSVSQSPVADCLRGPVCFQAESSAPLAVVPSMKWELGGSDIGRGLRSHSELAADLFDLPPMLFGTARLNAVRNAWCRCTASSSLVMLHVRLEI
jgi:hypothetical protein